MEKISSDDLKRLKNKAGIYGIQHIDSGKLYIGSTSNLYARLTTHKSSLRKGKHHSCRLQADWDTYGENCFQFILFQELETDTLEILELERDYINTYQSSEAHKGYNILAITNLPPFCQTFSQENQIVNLSLVEICGDIPEEAYEILVEIWSAKGVDKNSGVKDIVMGYITDLGNLQLSQRKEQIKSEVFHVSPREVRSKVKSFYKSRTRERLARLDNKSSVQD